ncbi:hypothetical protein [uncultured Tateyamaria sp.]|uniref:hypothetical protein n=1 Tax=uncultured Tateyamaria sp. TaxID=455651 RepID=UPI002618B93D|nr:hypothetical protein [uncultured Tateyamaria sp.]
MSTKPSISRRGFVAMNAAGAAMAAMPAVAATPAAVEAVTPVGPFNWITSGAAELSVHVGQRFRFQDEDGHSTVMRLIEVSAVDSGADRPAHLPRTEGVVAVFDGPDIAPLAEAGHRLYRVGAAGLGRADVMAGPVPRRDGSNVIEIVLN